VSASRTHARAPERVDGEVDELRLLEERTRWAMHIHDGVTQSVTSVVLLLRELRQLIATDPHAALDVLEPIEREVRADLHRIRTVLFELDEGRTAQGPPLQGFVDDLVRRWRLSARVSLEGDVDQAPAAVLETAHAVIAEALANAAKHAGTPDVAIRVRNDHDGMRVEIEDRGRGIAATSSDDGEPHLGLRMLRRRAEDIGGTIEIGSTPGGGTRVVALLPVGGRGD
jgi:two-component system, NarL family, nitrate/nitrite sensor histidine kinase NarX